MNELGDLSSTELAEKIMLIAASAIGASEGDQAIIALRDLQILHNYAYAIYSQNLKSSRQDGPPTNTA